MKWYKSSRQTCCFAWHVTFNYSLLMMPYKGWMFKNWDKQIPNCYQWTCHEKVVAQWLHCCLTAIWLLIWTSWWAWVSTCSLDVLPVPLRIFQTGVDVRGCGYLCLCVSPLMGHVLGVPWFYPYNTWDKLISSLSLSCQTKVTLKMATECKWSRARFQSSKQPF